MARKRKRPQVDFDAAAKYMAKTLDVKRRMIEEGIKTGDLTFVRELIDDVRLFRRRLIEDIEVGIRDGSLDDMTPEQAQQAIYGIKIFEDSLRVDYPELMH